MKRKIWETKWNKNNTNRNKENQIECTKNNQIVKYSRPPLLFFFVRVKQGNRILNAFINKLFQLKTLKQNGNSYSRMNRIRLVCKLNYISMVRSCWFQSLFLFFMNNFFSTCCLCRTLLAIIHRHTIDHTYNNNFD